MYLPTVSSALSSRDARLESNGNILFPGIFLRAHFQKCTTIEFRPQAITFEQYEKEYKKLRSPKFLDKCEGLWLRRRLCVDNWGQKLPLDAVPHCDITFVFLGRIVIILGGRIIRTFLGTIVTWTDVSG